MVRAPFFDKYGMKKGAWSEEEDDKLRSYVLRYGHWNWRELPKYAGLKRCGKSCRLRWMNYLRPELKHGNFTEEEDSLIMKLHEELGNRWSTIAKSLPGRTDNEIKNHWHTVLKARAKGKEHSSSTSKISHISESSANATHNSEGEAESVLIDTPTNLNILESSPLSPKTSSSTDELSSSSLNVGSGIENICFPSSSSEIYETQSSGDFWSEPFVADNIYNLDGFGLSLPYDMYHDYDDFCENFFYHLM